MYNGVELVGIVHINVNSRVGVRIGKAEREIPIALGPCDGRPILESREGHAVILVSNACASTKVTARSGVEDTPRIVDRCRRAHKGDDRLL